VSKSVVVFVIVDETVDLTDTAEDTRTAEDNGE